MVLPTATNQAEHFETSFNFWRPLQAFTAMRLCIAFAVIVYFVSNLIDIRFITQSLFAFQGCALYFAGACFFSVLALKWRRYFHAQLFTQLGIDLAMIALLCGYAGTKNGLAILYLFPLAGAAILTSIVSGLFFASLATIILLLQNFWQSIVREGTNPQLFESGLYGVAFFATVLLLHQLAARLIRQESLALSRGRDLQRQVEINRLVIADMQDGVLVVDDNGQLFAANPAAGQLLGMSWIAQKIGHRLFEFSQTKPIGQAFHAWKQHVEDLQSHTTEKTFLNGASHVVEIQPDSVHAASTVAIRLQLRFIKVSVPSMTDTATVIFLEDAKQIEDRAQQLKLASMGRLTASIAHEVRNPLAAIAYASSLLTEELNALVQTPANHPARLRFLKIIDDNVSRLNRMVEDILQLSRKVKSSADLLSLREVTLSTIEEFQQVQNVNKETIVANINPSAAVYFDPLHLREVIWNLLSNAIRYASGKPNSVRIFTHKNQNQTLELHVQNDGPIMTEQTRLHLFEPFFTTEAKGTGLGLYLARELCLNNGANLSYEYRGDATEPLAGRFVVSFMRYEVDQREQIILLT